MTLRAHDLARLVLHDVRRSRGPLATAGLGIVVGTAALAFFLSLGVGARQALLSDLFPLDKIELEPVAQADPGLLALVLGSNAAPPSIAQATVEALARAPGVTAVYPKLRLAFPSSARGGKDIIGHDIASGEMIADGIDPSLVKGDVLSRWRFDDPWNSPGAPCAQDSDCDASKYCELPSLDEQGRCVDPVPALVSRYLVEVFNRGIAPAHKLPRVGETLLKRASGVTFTLRLGESLLGASKQGKARRVRVRVVGISSEAIDLGLTLPLATVQRWNREYAGEASATAFSSVLVKVQGGEAATGVIDLGRDNGLAPKDTRARDISVLVNLLTALLSLIAAAVLMMGGTTIAYTFRAMLQERRGEIGVCRAVGASSRDIVCWHMTLALVAGFAYALVGVVIAWCTTRLVDWLAATRLPDFPFKPETFFGFPWWVPCAAVLVGVVFAVLGAWRPTVKAAKGDARETLLEHG